MSYEFYKILHFSGLFMLVLGTTGILVLKELAAQAPEGFTPPSKKFFSIIHGVGLLISLVAGFGLLARTGHGFPGWIGGKLALWLLIGLAPLFCKWIAPRLVAGLVLIALVSAAYLAVLRP